MGWRVIKQPNGLYARFSEVVDYFTVWNATAEEITKEIIQAYPEDGERLAAEKLEAANLDWMWCGGNKGRWKEALLIIRMVHGREKHDAFLAEYDEQENRKVLKYPQRQRKQQ